MRKNDSDNYHSTSGDNSASDGQGDATSDSTYGSSHIVLDTSAEILLRDVNQPDFSLKTAEAIQKINPYVVPERLVELTSVFKSVFQMSSSHDIYTQAAHAQSSQV